MVWAAPALAAVTLCLRVSTDLLKATAAVLILGAALSSAEHPRVHFHDVYNLGEPVCELELATIPASDPDILEKLKLCPALTGAQRDALNALLLSGATAYGDPSSWDLQTLQDLGPLVLALNQTMLGLVGKAAREDFRSSIAAAYLSQGRSQRGKSLILLRALAAASAAARPRLKHSSGRCESKLVTASNIEDIPYISAEELDLCLSSEVLIENLEAVLELPVTTESLRVLKKKVDEVYPSGIPEEQLRHLGQLSHLYTEQEISQWPVTSNDTLTALLSSSGELWEDSQVQQLFKRYLALGGSWTGPLLQEIGGEFLCKLQEEQIQQIPSGAIGTAGQLNIFSCSQTKKELLYGKAREAFASLASTPGPYYCRIRPYLGGAPAEDLKDLANAGVTNMDQDTFLALNPQEFQKLSVTDVKNLLGKNLPELKKAEHEPWVVSWVQRQFQRELDCVLGIGLEGGLPDPTGTSPATATSSVTTPTTVTSMVTATTPVPTTPTTATSSVTTPTTATFSVTATIPVPTTPVTATSTVTATTPVPTTPASVTSIATVPTSPHPVTSANVTSFPTTLPTVPVTSASATTLPPIPSATSASGTSMATNPVPTTLLTVPTTSAISSHSTPQPSTVPPRTPTLSTLSPSDTPTHTARPPVPPATGPVPTATPAPCSTHQAVTRDRATSPAVTSPAVPSPATSSPSATPVPAVTSGAITSTGVGTNLAGTTHSTVPNPSSPPTVTTVPKPSSPPTVTTVPCPSSTLTITTVPSSAPTVTPVSHSSSAATATHSTVTPVPNSTSAPTVTSVPNPTSSPTATHSTATTVSNSTSPTVTSVPKPSSSPSVPPISQSPPAPGPSTVPAPSPSPIPSSTVPTPAVPCQPGSPPAPPSTSPSPGNVPESPAPSPNGYINLQPPEPGSGSRLCSCLVPMLAATVGRILLL